MPDIARVYVPRNVFFANARVTVVTCITGNFQVKFLALYSYRTRFEKVDATGHRCAVNVTARHPYSSSFATFAPFASNSARKITRASLYRYTPTLMPHLPEAQNTHRWWKARARRTSLARFTPFYFPPLRWAHDATAVAACVSFLLSPLGIRATWIFFRDFGGCLRSACERVIGYYQETRVWYCLFGRHFIVFFFFSCWCGMMVGPIVDMCGVNIGEEGIAKGVECERRFIFG